MAYSEFTLEEVKVRFRLKTDETGNHFASINPATVSSWLTETLKETVPLGLAISTEKARSEMIVVPVLIEARRQFGGKASLFSGVDFTVDADLGLRGVVDYLFSLSPEQLMIESPVIAIVEAKNESFKTGYGQCIAEMYAATLFNRQRKNNERTVFGAVTTGSAWKFLRLIGDTVFIDVDEYHISQAERIVGILVAMLRGNAA